MENKNILELTEKEKEAYKTFSKKWIENPLGSVEEGLVQSYYGVEDYKEFKEAVYGYTKRLLTEVAKKRGLDIDPEATFEINDMIEDQDLEDFDLKNYQDYELLKKYVENKIKNMNAEETEELYHKFGGRIGSMQDNFREFMTRYVPKISSNVYELVKEIQQDNVVEEKYTVFDEQPLDENDEDWGIDDEELEVISSDDAFDWVSDDDEWLEEYETSTESKQNEKEKVSDKELLEYIKFLNTYSKLMTYKGNGEKIVDEFVEIVKTKKLSEFYDKKEFFEDFKKIMEHDKTKHNYLFHGTQDLESAESVMNEGLGMMRDDLSSTTYSEFSMDDVILYSRGFAGEIGRDAIIIIDQPINEDGTRENIVQEIDENKKIHFAPSGLQGLNGKPQYIVDSKYIIGYVNKRDKEIIFNPRYYDYAKFNRKTEKTKYEITPNEVENVTSDINIDLIDKAKNNVAHKLQEKNDEIERNSND